MAAKARDVPMPGGGTGPVLPHGRGTASWGWQRRNPVLGCSAPTDKAENPLEKIFLGLGWAQLAASARTQKWPKPRA